MERAALPSSGTDWTGGSQDPTRVFTTRSDLCRPTISDVDYNKSSPLGGQYRGTVPVYRLARPPLRLTARREIPPAGRPLPQTADGSTYGLRFPMGVSTRLHATTRPRDTSARDLT